MRLQAAFVIDELQRRVMPVDLSAAGGRVPIPAAPGSGLGGSASGLPAMYRRSHCDGALAEG